MNITCNGQWSDLLLIVATTVNILLLFIYLYFGVNRPTLNESVTSSIEMVLKKFENQYVSGNE